MNLWNFSPLDKLSLIAKEVSKVHETKSTELLIPAWLIGLIAAVCVVAILAFLYMIFAFRRVSIVSKKMDYLVEDLTFKSEKLQVLVEAVVKLSSYVNVAEAFLKRNADSIANYIKNNKQHFENYENRIQTTLEDYLEKHKDDKD